MIHRACVGGFGPLPARPHVSAKERLSMPTPVSYWEELAACRAGSATPATVDLDRIRREYLEIYPTGPVADLYRRLLEQP